MKKEMKTLREKHPNWTVPNLLSVIRILVIVPFAIFFLQGDILWAVLMLAISGLSDCFDGMIARKFNQVTELGKMLDPLADKLTQGTVAVCLAVEYPILIPVLSIFVAKELLMLVAACVLLKRKKRPSAAKWYGKVGTILFYFSAGAVVVMEGIMQMHNALSLTISYSLLGITALFMLYALFQYARLFLRTLHSDQEQDELDLMRELHPGKDKK